MASVDKDVEQFFGAYFHQDWPEEHQSWQGVAEHFAKDSGEQLTRHVATGVHMLSQAAVSDDELSQKLQALGCYYWPGSEAGYRSWLKELAAYLFAVAANPSFKGDVPKRAP
jgi:CdiI immunity protein